MRGFCCTATLSHGALPTAAASACPVHLVAMDLRRTSPSCRSLLAAQTAKPPGANRRLCQRPQERFTRHRQGCRTGNEGFQSSHQPDNESIAQARSPSSRFFEQGVRFRNHESRSIRREGSRQISRSCRTCCVRVDARAIVPRPINVMRRQISQKGLPLWGNISISC